MRRTQEQIYRWQEGRQPERSCATCGTWAPLSEFRYRHKVGNYNSECRRCENERRLDRYYRAGA
jgi:hypothetical protein